MAGWKDTIPEIPDDLEIRDDAVPVKTGPAESRDPPGGAPVDPVQPVEPGRAGESAIAEVGKGVELIADDVPPLLIAILDELKTISSKLQELST